MRWSADAPKPVQRSSGAPKPRVLVVDDNGDLRGYIHTLLSPLYDVTVAADGREGVESAIANPPDIIVSDVMMPRLDGTGLVRELRAYETTASIPVILLSARVGEESAIEGLDAGADDYVAKPFSARELIARVRTHIQLAAQRREFVRELERANHELDAFSSSVSHDLRTPVGHVKGFVELLRDDPSSVLSDRSRRYVDNILTASTRMLSLIEHLLRFAKISRQTLDLATTDLSAMAADVVSILRHSAKERTIDIRIAPDVYAHCDAGLTRLVLDNLLSNAFKYSSKTIDARVVFGTQHSAEGTVYFVRDNGAGFDPALSEKLFSAFGRLHAESEFAGTGIGLATVQRIVARHGGRIWAHGAVGEGATFYFTLAEA
ncbi:MAG: response regulator [Clostridia bacterium]|nr:response regulator [Deltaproteobacteria bacterium]